MIYDVKKHHYEISAIKKYMNLAPLAPETMEKQQGMLNLWNDNREEFNSRLFWDIEKITAWKLQVLSQLVDWAFSTSTFYKKIYSNIGFELGGIRSYSDFESLPIITRDDLISHFPNEIPSNKYNINECRWMSSSGSSGKPVQIILPQKRADLDTLFKYRMFEFMGGFKLAPSDWLYNIGHAMWWHTSILGQYKVFSVSQDCPPEEILKHIKLLKPTVISSLGSYLEKLSSVSGNLSEHGVKLISTNSESTSKNERIKWSEIFGIPVCDEYSSEELDLLGMECPYRNYHTVEDDCHMEIIEQEKNNLMGVVGTDLWNLAMPIIRYYQGDLADWDSNNELCSCGSSFRRIKNLHGRADQAFFSISKGKILPGSLMDAAEEFLCADNSGIREFRVIQTHKDKVDLLLVNNGNVENKDILTGFEEKLSYLFGYKITLQTNRVEFMPIENSFKRRTFLNKYKHQSEL